MSTREKIAVPLEGAPGVVVLNNGDRMKRSTAKAQGWKIYGEPDATASDNETTAKLTADRSWRGAVLALPEARDRGAAATEIVNTHTEHTMSVFSARAFLRGLPTELARNHQDERTARAFCPCGPRIETRLSKTRYSAVNNRPHEGLDRCPRVFEQLLQIQIGVETVLWVMGT
jgi:hypothetical protein